MRLIFLATFVCLSRSYMHCIEYILNICIVLYMNCLLITTVVVLAVLFRVSIEKAYFSELVIFPAISNAALVKAMTHFPSRRLIQDCTQSLEWGISLKQMKRQQEVWTIKNWRWWKYFFHLFYFFLLLSCLSSFWVLNL